MRWAATGMLVAQGQFRSVTGYPSSPRALERATAEESGLLDLGAAASR